MTRKNVFGILGVCGLFFGLLYFINCPISISYGVDRANDNATKTLPKQTVGETTPAGWKKENLTREILVNDFKTPPVGYGNVAFYWWLGDP
ncbi:MAG: hypothetical protein LBT09_08520, partial [Planctomycetaceae bacterium]|nr:hypothetical protein [Planctomycetaceae bacterium]